MGDNIVDATAKFQKEGGDEVVPLLSAIFDHQQKNAEMHQRQQDHWWAEDRAKEAMVRHGVLAALAQCPFGGTTAEYELCMERIRTVLSQGTGDPIYHWYLEKQLKVIQDAEMFSKDSDPVHPNYARHTTGDFWNG